MTWAEWREGHDRAAAHVVEACASGDRRRLLMALHILAGWRRLVAFQGLVTR